MLDSLTDECPYYDTKLHLIVKLPGALENGEYAFIAITFRSTLTQSVYIC